jgi:hypothetical protein
MSNTIYPINDKGKKRLELGERAKVLLDLHLENPKKYDSEFVLNYLLNQYEKLQLDIEEKKLLINFSSFSFFCSNNL